MIMRAVLLFIVLCFGALSGAEEWSLSDETKQMIHDEMSRIAEGILDVYSGKYKPKNYPDESTTGYSRTTEHPFTIEPTDLNHLPSYSTESEYSQSSKYPEVEMSSDYSDSQFSTTESSYSEYSTYSSKSSEDYPATEPDNVQEGYRAGSISGIPGEHFPDYDDIPITSFTCLDKAHIPGFYADMETGCQVFHVCWPHRRESFLCPVGTTFNQAILACDYWYSSNCSLAQHYYDTNAFSSSQSEENIHNLGSMVDILLDRGQPTSESSLDESTLDSDFKHILKFLPVKAKVTVYPETPVSQSKIVAEASVGKTRKVHKHLKSKAKQNVAHDYDTAIPELSAVKPETKVTVDAEVFALIGEILDMAKRIVKEAEEFIPLVKDTQAGYVTKVKSAHQQPLTKLNPKFITKPVKISKAETSTGKTFRKLNVKPQMKVKFIKQTSKVVPEMKATKSQKLVKSVESVSSKKALLNNYLRLLKLT